VGFEEEASTFTLDWYARLPEMYRNADTVEPSGGGQPLLRFLDLLGTQGGEVEALAASATHIVDPELADSVGLPWLAQMVGIRLPSGYTDNLARAMIASHAGWRAGSPQAIATAVLPVLVDDGNPPMVSVGPDPANPWIIQIVLSETQAPSPLSLVDDAIDAAGVRPAGFATDVISSYQAPWGEFNGLTWGDLATVGDEWGEIDQADL
jgi:hypothetical protein